MVPEGQVPLWKRFYLQYRTAQEAGDVSMEEDVPIDVARQQGFYQHLVERRKGMDDTFVSLSWRRD